MRLISWNIQQGGGYRTRQICEHLDTWTPDICVLIEYRNTEPSRAIRDHLQRQLKLAHIVETVAKDESHWTYGLLIASREPLREISQPLTGAIPQRWRLLEVGSPRILTLGAAYVPNRGEAAGDKRGYLASLLGMAREWMDAPCLMVGDFNTGRRRHDEEAPYFDNHEDAFMTGMEQAGWINAFRAFHPDDRHYSYWNQRGGRRTGFLIDHAFVNKALSSSLFRCELLHDEPSWPSDHAALVLEWNNT